ncbi:MAG: hypothetical protein QM754_00885 [Tepidisphaeraceae bacterium]
MSHEMEEMEARLAGYIDGTLPPAQCAEIEAYLKSNPTHAKLITELQSIRSAVASLPRENAPAEVLDTLQANLERHSLLENVEESVTPMRISHWPQFGAVAAVLLLTTGLGVLIYTVMPSGRPSQNDLALLTSSAASQPEGGDTVPSEGVALNNDLAKPSAPGAVPPVAANAPTIANNNARQQQFYNNANNSNNARDESQNQQQFGMAQQTPTQQPQTPVLGGDNASRDRQFSAMAKRENVIAAEKSLSAEAVPATQPTAVNVLLVRTEDPALTSNLLIGGLVQENVRFVRLSTATTQPGEELNQAEIEEIVTKLQTSGDLPPGTARNLLLPARPLYVPNVPGLTIGKLTATLSVPGVGFRSSKVVSYTRAQPLVLGQAGGESPTTQKLLEQPGFRFDDTMTADFAILADVGTAPATKPAASSQPSELAKTNYMSAADWYVLIVHDTKPAATQPVAVPTTAPAVTQPAGMGEMP